MGFRDCCACGADLHVCRNCSHHDPAAYNECREPNAERVGDRDRANRCDYFVAREGTAKGGSSPLNPRDALENLFKKRP